MKLGSVYKHTIQKGLAFFHIVFIKPPHWWVRYRLEDFHSMQTFKRENPELLEALK